MKKLAILAILAAATVLLVLFAAGCPTPGGPAGTVATPTFSIIAGTYDTDQLVSITCATSEATIYYTTNGTQPSTASSEYSAPISVAGDGTTMTIKAIAVKSDMTTSGGGSATYVISYTIIAPVISPTTVEHFESFYVEMTCPTVGATIYYTTDNSPPTTSSSVYSLGSIHVTSDNTSLTIRAIAGKGVKTSPEATPANYWVKMVYTAGWKYTSQSYPYFWVGTIGTLVTNGTSFPAAMNSIYLNSVNNWVYMAGWQKVPAQTYQYAISAVNSGTSSSTIDWLNQDAFDAEARSVFFYNNDIYSAGYYDSSASARNPCYWTNSTKTNLPYGTGTGGEASAIYVNSSHIYTAGDYRISTAPFVVPCYWTDTTKTDLAGDGTHTAQAYSIFVDGSTVYTAGYYRDAAKENACYWTNTAKTDLPGDGSHRDVAQSIFVSSGTVYTAGYYNDGSKDNACYWTGTTKTNLDGDGSHASMATGITVYGTHIFVSGYYLTASAKVACFWVVTGGSQTRYDLSSTSSGSQGQAAAIYVNP